MDKDCSERYYCRLSEGQHVSNKLKSEANSLRTLSRKVNSQGFESVSNGTCALKGNSKLMFDGVTSTFFSFRIRRDHLHIQL